MDNLEAFCNHKFAVYATKDDDIEELKDYLKDFRWCSGKEFNSNLIDERLKEKTAIYLMCEMDNSAGEPRIYYQSRNNFPMNFPHTSHMTVNEFLRNYNVPDFSENDVLLMLGE